LYSDLALPQERGNDKDDDDDDEWEYLEYDDLKESDFIGSEWLVGTNFDRQPDKIQETWARCIINNEKDGKQPCIWGDGSTGSWSFDRASQYFSMSKEYPWGKTIWAGTVEDYYYLQGTVRGWTYFSAAQVVGQWQSKRLGVDPDEAGTAPWFEEEEQRQDDDDDAENQPETKEPETETEKLKDVSEKLVRTEQKE
jgi:succinate dehydrogenase/fumarate reductase flavoprotein subunit